MCVNNTKSCLQVALSAGCTLPQVQCIRREIHYTSSAVHIKMHLLCTRFMIMHYLIVCWCDNNQMSLNTGCKYYIRSYTVSVMLIKVFQPKGATDQTVICRGEGKVKRYSSSLLGELFIFERICPIFTFHTEFIWVVGLSFVVYEVFLAHLGGVCVTGNWQQKNLSKASSYSSF